MAMTNTLNEFEQLISPEHLYNCWYQFKRGKKKRKDIQQFERHLDTHIFHLHDDLKQGTYRHGPYSVFYVFDPKERKISKASVRDRLVHHVIHGYVSQQYDPIFIHHSMASRIGKGTHQGVWNLRRMISRVSQNGRRPCWALKMDVARFFDTVSHAILKQQLTNHIHDPNIREVLMQIIDSFQHDIRSGIGPVGLPIGNITSQILSNVYLHPFDLFVKHELKHAHYIRYCDDWIMVSSNRESLYALIKPIQTWMWSQLKLTLHPKKVTIRKMSEGIDFLGYITFPKYRLLRSATRRRMQRRLKQASDRYYCEDMDADAMNQCLKSYLGLLSHADQYALSMQLHNEHGSRPD